MRFLTRIAHCGRPRIRPTHESPHSSKRYCESSTHQHRKTENGENTPTQKYNYFVRKISKQIYARGTSSVGAKGVGEMKDRAELVTDEDEGNPHMRIE